MFFLAVGIGIGVLVSLCLCYCSGGWWLVVLVYWWLLVTGDTTRASGCLLKSLACRLISRFLARLTFPLVTFRHYFVLHLFLYLLYRFDF